MFQFFHTACRHVSVHRPFGVCVIFLCSPVQIEYGSESRNNRHNRKHFGKKFTVYDRPRGLTLYGDKVFRYSQFTRHERQNRSFMKRLCPPLFQKDCLCLARAACQNIFSDLMRLKRIIPFEERFLRASALLKGVNLAVSLFLWPQKYSRIPP